MRNLPSIILVSAAAWIAAAVLASSVPGALAHEAEHAPDASPPAPPAAAVLPPVAARYVEIHRALDDRDAAPAERTGEWFFVRSPDRIETGRPDYAEIWERDERGAIALKRVFHADRKVIEYTTGELNARRMTPDWSALGAIVDGRNIAALPAAGETAALGRPARRHAGRLGEEDVEIVMLTVEALPARIVRARARSSYSLELKELRDAPGEGWPRAGWAETRDYEIIDAADLGDREYDPFVRKLLAIDAAGRGGRPHAH